MQLKLIMPRFLKCSMRRSASTQISTSQSTFSESKFKNSAMKLQKMHYKSAIGFEMTSLNTALFVILIPFDFAFTKVWQR